MPEPTPLTDEPHWAKDWSKIVCPKDGPTSPTWTTTTAPAPCIGTTPPEDGACRASRLIRPNGTPSIGVQAKMAETTTVLLCASARDRLPHKPHDEPFYEGEPKPAFHCPGFPPLGLDEATRTPTTADEWRQVAETMADEVDRLRTEVDRLTRDVPMAEWGPDGTYCRTCGGVSPDWYDPDYHGLPEVAGRTTEGTRTAALGTPSQPPITARSAPTIGSNLMGDRPPLRKYAKALAVEVHALRRQLATPRSNEADRPVAPTSPQDTDDAASNCTAQAVSHPRAGRLAVRSAPRPRILGLTVSCDVSYSE